MNDPAMVTATVRHGPLQATLTTRLIAPLHAGHLWLAVDRSKGGHPNPEVIAWLPAPHMDNAIQGA